MFLNSLTQTDKPQNPQFITPVIKPQKDYEEFNNVESFEHLFMAEPENAESTVQFDAEEYEEHQENPNQETPTEFPKSDIKQYFTFDDVPLSKWRERSSKDVSETEFISSPWEHTTYAREEFLKMKCCSFQKKDLEKHYDRMSHQFYCLNGVDDVNLKQVILNSFPKYLGNEAYRALEKKFIAEYERTRKCLGTTCDDKYLQIKCKDKSSCDCHFARNCPDKKRSQELIQALNQVEPVDDYDLELLYSLDDEPSDSVLCTIAYSDFSSDDDSDTDSLKSESNFGVHMINPIPHVLPIQEDPPLPLAKIHLLMDAYVKPIPDISFFDTGSLVSILNPNILPDHCWEPRHQNFMAANGEKFIINKISVLINIRMFPKCIIKRRLLGSSSHGKDLLIGFDILHKLPNLPWSVEADDKFPLPQMKSLFQHLTDAKVLSKFDPKSGFLKSNDNHFEPILANTPVYIDDILLFSPDEQSQAKLLSKFYSLVTKYGIMLSEKKMEVGVTTIQFLGMEIFDGKYQPQPHVAQELLKFPNELSSQKVIQQFLGLVNYMADFLPKLSHHTALLFPMLKKSSPQWTPRQTKAVKAIKCLAEKMPPLKMSVGERSYLFKIIIIKYTFMDTRMARLKHLSSIITPRSRKPS
ncbi:hypothetical protein Tco_0525286 [Tanacetum coccineum]